jgi:protein-S-isoprenylcysteine O-methyltransferase Ste14
MNSPPLLDMLRYIWIAFGLYWIIAAKHSRKAGTHEPAFHRVLRWAILVITFTLLFWRQLDWGVLGRRAWPEVPGIAVAGFVATLLGLVVAIWARMHLGEYWSDKVVLKLGHRLIRTGPYAHMRHPIYSGVLLGVLGTAVVLGKVRGLLAFLMLLTNYAIKARREDKLLSSSFPDEFRIHAQHAGFLLPKLRL